MSDGWDGWDGMGLSYTAVTPRASLQSDANNMTLQVGPEEDGYRLTVVSFNEAESTLGDSMSPNNGMKFSTK